MSRFLLAGIMVLAIIALCLAVVGIYGIRAGLRSLSSTELHEPIWHKNPNILFGINNILFAILLGLVSLAIIVPSSTIKTVFLILTVITFIISVCLVIRGILAALHTAKNLRNKKTKNTL